MLGWLITLSKYLIRLNKKGLEEQGMHFSTGNIIKLGLFILLVFLLVIIIIPKLTDVQSGKALYNFGSGVFEMLGGE